MMRIVVILAWLTASAYGQTDQHIGDATTAAQYAAGGVWTSPASAAVDDGTYATVSLANSTTVVRKLRASGFTWGVPDDACLVFGVTVRVKVRGTGDAAIASVYLGSSGALGDPRGVDAPIGAETWLELGGPTDLWGLEQSTWGEWQPILNQVHIAVKSTSGAATAEVDHVQYIVWTTSDKSPAAAVGDSGFFLERAPNSPTQGTPRLHVNLNRFRAKPVEFQRVEEVQVGTNSEGLPLVVFRPSGAPLTGDQAASLGAHFTGFAQRGLQTFSATLAANERFEGNISSGTLWNTFNIGFDGLKTIWFVPNTWNGSPGILRRVPGLVGSGVPSSDPVPGAGVYAPWATLGEKIEDLAPSAGMVSHVLADKNRRWVKRSPHKYDMASGVTWEPDYFVWMKYQLVANEEGGDGGSSEPPQTPTDPTWTAWTLPDQATVSTKLDTMNLWPGYMPSGIPYTPWAPPTDGGTPTSQGQGMPDPPVPTAWTFTIPGSWFVVLGNAQTPDLSFTVTWTIIAQWLPLIHAFWIGWALIWRIGHVLEEFRKQ